jgi:hypothetical protein
MRHGDLRSTLGPAVSRRSIIHGTGVGLAAAALPPARRASAASSSTTVWSYLDGTARAGGSPTVGTGVVIVTEATPVPTVAEAILKTVARDIAWWWRR